MATSKEVEKKRHKDIQEVIDTIMRMPLPKIEDENMTNYDDAIVVLRLTLAKKASEGDVKAMDMLMKITKLDATSLHEHTC